MLQPVPVVLSAVILTLAPWRVALAAAPQPAVPTPADFAPVPPSSLNLDLDLKLDLATVRATRSPVALAWRTPSVAPQSGEPGLAPPPVSLTQSPLPPATDPDFATQLQQAIATYEAGNAAGAAAQLAPLAETVQAREPGLAAQVFYWLGLSQAVAGDKVSGWQNLQQGLSLAEQQEARDLARQAMQRLTELARFITNAKIATEHYQRAVSFFERWGPRESYRVALLGLGSSLGETGQPEEGIATLMRVRQICQQEGDRDLEQTALSNLGEIYGRLGRLPEAQKMLTEAIALAESLGDRRAVLIGLINRGVNERALGQLETAEATYQRALPLAQELKETSLEATVLNNLGRLYDSLGRFAEARRYYEQSLVELERLNDRVKIAYTRNNLATLLNGEGKTREALAIWQVVVEELQELGDAGGMAIILSNMGTAHANLGQAKQAQENYERALERFRRLGRRADEAIVLRKLGQIAGERGDRPAAVALHRQALERIAPTGSRLTHQNILQGLGHAEARNGNLPEAIAQWEAALQLLLGTRRELRRENREPFIQAQVRNFSSLVEALVESGQAGRAYEWSNLIVRSELADYSRFLGAKVPDEAAQAEIDRWTAEGEKLAQLRDTLRSRFDEEAARRLAEASAALNRQAEGLARRYPVLAELLEISPADLARMQATLAPGQVVLHPIALLPSREKTGEAYQPAGASEDALLVFVIDRDRLAVERVPIQAEAYLAAIEAHRAEVSRFSITKRYRQTGATLYNWLIRPVEAHLRSRPAGQPLDRLSIIASGSLRYIPLETLYDDQRGEFLIQQYPLHNLARLSGKLDDPLPSGPRRVLAMGNPFPEDSARRLDGANAEVQAIQGLLPEVATYLGPAAKLETFRLQAPRFSVLHVATHGCFVAEGCPQFGMAGNTVLFADRNLDIVDAALLGLKDTELVTLSACQTAIRTAANGQEFAGLAYLLERAGAKAVVASLWNVNDQSTRDLMVGFYRALQQGEGKAKALRSAKLAVIDRHPFYWSAFVLIGDGR